MEPAMITGMSFITSKSTAKTANAHTNRRKTEFPVVFCTKCEFFALFSAAKDLESWIIRFFLRPGFISWENKIRNTGDSEHFMKRNREKGSKFQKA